MQQLTGYLRLMRPANIVTAIADILAGIAISGYFSNRAWAEVDIVTILLLVLATVGLYGGGVVLNDVFDAELDKVERPERPIPSGLIPKQNATVLGVGLLLLGIVSAFFVHPAEGLHASVLIAALIAVAAVVYDKWGKHHSVVGPLNMGLCRGLNLLLGISILPEALMQNWVIAFVPILYIAAITMISRGEVHGGSRKILYSAVFLYIIVIASIAYVGVRNHTIVWSLVFLLFFALMIFPPLWKAIQEPAGRRIGKAVKAGVIALIIMNGAWAAAFGSIYLALFIVLLLPLSLLLAKAFAVT